jgi:integrase
LSEQPADARLFESLETLALKPEPFRLFAPFLRKDLCLPLDHPLPTHSHSIKLFAAVDDYLEAKKATANTQRAIDFDRERLEVVKRLLGDVRLSTISSRVIEGFQAKRRVEGASNRTVNMDVGALRQVLKRFKQWRRLEDDVKMLTESGGEPVGRVLTLEEQKRLFKTAEANPDWEHVYCAAILAANTSMRGVEVKHVRRKDFDAKKRIVHIRTSKNETSKRVIPLNDSAFEAVQRMVRRADLLGHTEPTHYFVVCQPAPQVGPVEAGGQLAHGLAGAAGCCRHAWATVSRLAPYGRDAIVGGRRTGPCRRVDHRAPLPTDAGALLAHPAERKEGSPGST